MSETIAAYEPDTLTKVLAVEAAIAKIAEHQDLAELPVRHWITPGVYTREIFIPAGVALSGKVHKHTHLCLLTQGTLIVYSEEQGRQTLTAPYTFVSGPGVKRVGYAVEDTVFATVHAIPAELEENIEAIEAYLVADTIEEYGRFLAGEKTPCLSD
jgi:hypothetical protein